MMPGGLELWMRGDVQRLWLDLVVVTIFLSAIFVECGIRFVRGLANFFLL